MKAGNVHGIRELAVQSRAEPCVLVFSARRRGPIVISKAAMEGDFKPVLPFDVGIGNR